jgi:hypothetical protein
MGLEEIGFDDAWICRTQNGDVVGFGGRGNGWIAVCTKGEEFVDQLGDHN